MRVRCPECGHETRFEGNPWRPFCTERCQLIDLGRWASEGYRLQGTEDAAADDSDPATPLAPSRDEP